MPTENTTERKHHLYSPSSLQMRGACSCFDNRGGSSEAAETGTRQHSVTETGLDDESLSDEAALHAADALDFAERQRTLLIEERQRAQVDVDTPLAEVIDLTEAYLAVDDLKFRDAVIREVKDESDPAKTTTERVVVTTESTTAGYVDRAFVSWDRKHAVMIDFKFGEWSVPEAAFNLQAISYSLGLFRMYPTLESIRFYFKLPKQIQTVNETTFTRAQVPELLLRVQTVVARAREAHRLMAANDFSMATPAVPVCNFCGNLGRCPAVAAIACRVAHKFHPIEIPSDVSPTNLLDGPDAGLGIRLSGVLAIWCKAFRSSVTDRVLRGDAKIPDGYKIESRSKREIADIKLFKAVTLKRLTTAELEECAEFSFGSVEKKVSAAAPRGSKKSEVEAYQSELLESGAVKRGDSYSFLKMITDKAE